MCQLHATPVFIVSRKRFSLAVRCVRPLLRCDGARGALFLSGALRTPPDNRLIDLTLGLRGIDERVPPSLTLVLKRQSTGPHIRERGERPRPASAKRRPAPAAGSELSFYAAHGASTSRLAARPPTRLLGWPRAVGGSRRAAGSAESAGSAGSAESLRETAAWTTTTRSSRSTRAPR